MIQTTTIRAELSQPNIPAVIYAKQHDADTRVVEVALYDNGAAYTVSGTVVGIVSIAKPDGTGCYYDVDSISGNVVTFTLVEQALTAAGTARAEISLIGPNEERLTSFAFDIIIEKRAIEDSTIISSDYYNALLETIGAAIRSVTFTPSVSAEGVISWTNDGGLENPASVNIKGADGQDATFAGLTANRAVITDANGGGAVSSTTSAELEYVSGVTSSIQTQLNSKQAAADDQTGANGSQADIAVTGNVQLVDNQLKNFTAGGTVTFVAPKTGVYYKGWAHGYFSTNTFANSVGFAPANFIWPVPVLVDNTSYEYDVYNGVWAIAEKIT